MRIKIISKILSVAIVVSLLSVSLFGGDDTKGSKLIQPKTSKLGKVQSGKAGDAYRLFINNVNLPMNRAGVLADVNVEDPNPIINGEGGKFAGDIALFSGGFFLSGESAGNMFANAVASATLVQDYVPGDVVNGRTDPRAQLYVLKASDPPYDPVTGDVHQSWLHWQDAVALGADFYDGDGDGVYNPSDKNGNKVWDSDEDRPDLLGDETVWCVYWDGLPSSQRRWNTVAPLGIEVRQTVFAFASAGAIGNIIFVRYRFKYVGFGGASEPNSLNDCYFGVWADPDIGESADDLLGCDILRNAGFVYNNGPDEKPSYGTQPPAFLIDFFQGPISYIPGTTFTDVNTNGVYDDGVDIPIDTAISVRGQIKGKKLFPGARNLGISSFVMYKNGDPTINDPSLAIEARRYTLGLTRNGDSPNPCNFAYGEVRGGVDCNTIDRRYWFSGDPVANTGWIATLEGDYRMMSNTGPFTLPKGEEKEIVVAYVFGQGTDAINSVAVAKRIDDGAQNIFDNNFVAPSAPPAPQPQVSAGEDFIDLIWDTKDQVSFTRKTQTYDIKFKGYNVLAYKTNSTSDLISGQENKKVIATYQANDFINNLYKENGNTGGIELLYPASPNKLDPIVYSNEATGRIRLRITSDPFTGGNLVKGKPYYFAITSYAVNHDALVNKLVDTSVFIFSDYYLSASSFVGEVENVPKIFTVTMSENLYSPPVPTIRGNQVAGGSDGRLEYDVISKDQLTGDKYKITFYQDKSTPKYSAFWKLENTSKGLVVRDSAKSYIYGTSLINDIVTEGFIVKLSNEVPDVDSIPRNNNTPSWFGANSVFHYLSTDINRTTKIKNIGGQLHTYNSSIVTADKLRRVKIKFGVSQKAYRYLNGFVGNNTSQRQRFFRYAENVTSANSLGDTVLLNGQWDAVNNRAIGYVDVPFQVWIDDPNFGESKQLAVGFIEKSTAFGGKPDGKWDAGTAISLSGEYIFIFDAPYDPNGNQNIYKGGPYIGGTNPSYADLNGGAVSNGAFYTIPNDANISAEERSIGRSSFFNTLYAVALERRDSNAIYTNSDEVILNVTKYPYTTADIFEFQTKKSGALTAEEEKALFQKVNVFPNPLYGFNIATSYTNSPSDEPFVTFSNLPEEVSIKIYSLSGNLLRTLDQGDKTSPTSPFLNWNLQNENGIRVASGLYLAIVSSPKYGEKVLKFSLIMPQKQLQRY